jgi:hypothetical protein
VRRAQLITTYGVGSMIALDEASYVIAGLDTWASNKDQQTHEPRLQRALGVPELRLPPSQDQYHGAALRRFPDWYSCQGCRILQPYRHFGATKSTCACGGHLIPSRFVLACENGHLDDFPYWLWVHRGTPETGECGDMQMETTGRTASLGSIEISCPCGKRASMEGAFRRAELTKLGIKCQGGRPWLGEAARMTGCSAGPRTLQRGSSAAWFGVVRSSLAIPPWSTRLQKAIDPHYRGWDGEGDDVIARQAARYGLLTDTITAQHIIDAVRLRQRLIASGVPDGADIEADLRSEEYEQLSNGTSDTGEDGDDFECRPSDGPPPAPEIGKVMLVKRLREVRVLESFTRIEPLNSADPAARRSALALDDVPWLPAIEVIGEGVFLQLSDDMLLTWEQNPHVEARADRIRRNHQHLLNEKGARAGQPAPSSPVTPRLVLIHTLAHILINEWSLDAGYPASAMRERLYARDQVAGILIYTATSDSAGSLGGIVRQGETHRLSRTLMSGLHRATWCSADPLCMEAEATGTDSLNLAACHVCTLLPETSCELNNTILDRGLLIGWPEQPNLGFFRQ